jgi:hypothetical protein
MVTDAPEKTFVKGAAAAHNVAKTRRRRSAEVGTETFRRDWRRRLGRS